jgi:propionyl-CoA carboxylase alpha chain
MPPVTTLLVANRGEIACRIIRAARGMGIRTVAVHSDPDARACHVEAADLAVPLGGERAADSYLRLDALLDAAARTGADAVHPGYGFLAENATFAQSCVDAGLTFIGPSPAVVAQMGDKLAAKAVMRSAGVPVLDSVAVETEAEAEAHVAAAGLPYPVIVKAAAGGGGKGMRVVTDPADLAEAVAAARREAAGAFGDDRVFVEPFVTRPRHVEVQILGDTYGTVLHVGERECSLQRRHQKVIEEAPSPAVDAALRVRLCRAAVDAALAIGYTNAGTVEFVLGADGDFAFLEVNTRLQVEHPVTELAWRLADGSPLDLVQLQLRIARGEALPFTQDDLVLAGHAIEARLYAEDPAAGFLPATGQVSVFAPHRAADVRWDEGVRQGDEVGVHYDPLLAKVIAAGPTRADAVAVLADALDRSRIHGVVTNRDFLVSALRHPAFAAGDLHTGFIAEHLDPVPLPTSDHPRHAVAAALAAARHRHRTTSVLPTIPPGWRNNPSQPQTTTYRVGDEELAVGYTLERDGTWTVTAGTVTAGTVTAGTVTAGGRTGSARVWAWPDERDDGALDLEFDGVRSRVLVSLLGDGVAVDSPAGHSTFTEVPRFADLAAENVAGGLAAPMPGTVVSVHVAEGDAVAAGDLLVVLEAMKMEHRLTAPHAGVVVGLSATAGAAVTAGDLLVVLAET